MGRYKKYSENMDWKEYGSMRKSARAVMYTRALRGDKSALNAFKNVSKDILRETNKRLRGLEKHNLAYGKEYNELQHYLQTQLDTTRILSATKLKNNITEIYYQNEHALKFLKISSTDWKKAKEIELYRLSIYKEAGIVPKNLSYKKSKDFLRFLSNEEVTAAIDEYGSSTEIVNMIYDYYTENTGLTVTKRFQLLEMAFSEFNSGTATFDDAMRKVGIKVEDYRSGRATS